MLQALTTLQVLISTGPSNFSPFNCCEIGYIKHVKVDSLRLCKPEVTMNAK